MVSDDRRVVVVGGGLGGGRACASLRAGGFAGDITLISGEDHPPYDRPLLSKSFLCGDVDPSLGIDLSALRVEVVSGVRATDLDLERMVVTTGQGEHRYDWLVLSTGAEPIRLPGSARQLSLRTVEDANRLRAGLVPGARVTIVGAGWIGAEVATAALAFGCEVTCIEADTAPLAGPLGLQVAEGFLPWWSDVDLRVGTKAAQVVDEGLLLTSGDVVGADVVVSGVGVRPDTAWLARAGLTMHDHGVAVDADRRTSDPSVFAVGDVASRWSDRLGARVHSGHWDEAVVGAAAAANAILDRPGAMDDVPYFWSDQFGRKVQYVGQHAGADMVVLRRHPEDEQRWGAAWVDEAGRLTAHLSVSFPRSMVQARGAILAGDVIDLERCRDLTHAL